jgi:hypothetical protein
MAGAAATWQCDVAGAAQEAVPRAWALHLEELAIDGHAGAVLTVPTAAPALVVDLEASFVVESTALATSAQLLDRSDSYPKVPPAVAALVLRGKSVAALRVMSAGAASLGDAGVARAAEESDVSARQLAPVDREVEGVAASRAVPWPAVAVVNLQHDQTLLPAALTAPT